MSDEPPGNLRGIVPIDLPTGFGNVRLERSFVLNPAVESRGLVRFCRTCPPFVNQEASGRVCIILNEYDVTAVRAISYLASDTNRNSHLEFIAHQEIIPGSAFLTEAHSRNATMQAIVACTRTKAFYRPSLPISR